MNIKCNGQQVISIEAGTRTRRYLIHSCECHGHEGNPGDVQCQFASFLTIDKDTTSETYSTKDLAATNEKRKLREEGVDTVRQQRAKLMVNHNALERPPTMETDFKIDGEECKLAVFDFETTALENGRVIEMGSAEMSKVAEGGEAAVKRAFVMPTTAEKEELSIELDAFEKNQIRMQQLLGAPNTGESLKALFGHWEKIKGDSKCFALVGHNIIKFDIPVLVEEMRRCGIRMDRLTKIVTHVIDTVPLFGKRSPIWTGMECGAPTNGELGTVYKHVLGKEMEDAHTALGDVIGCAKILLELDSKLEHASVVGLDMVIKQIQQAAH